VGEAAPIEVIACPQKRSAAADLRVAANVNVLSSPALEFQRVVVLR
jgi:hypothetical protein